MRFEPIYQDIKAKGYNFIFNQDKLHLKLLVFFQYLAFGSIIPILSLYLTKNLNFTGTQTGLIMSTSAISAIAAPLMGTFIADRLISAERLFAICNLGAAILIFWLSSVNSFQLFFIGYLGYMMFMGPTIPLSNTIIFHHVESREQDYGKIRRFGTFGWISAAVIFGWGWLRMQYGTNTAAHLSEALILASIGSIFCVVISMAIPPSGAAEQKNVSLFPKEALQTFLKPKILMVSILALILFSADRFFFLGSAPFMKELGYNESDILPILSIGQFFEIFAMSFLGSFITKFSKRKVLIFGAGIDALRFILLAFAGEILHIIPALTLHGISYTFFFAVAYIYLDSHTNKSNRAGVHQIYRIITSGFGYLLGNFLAGWFSDYLGIFSNNPEHYKYFWIAPGIIGFLVMFGLIFILEEETAEDYA